VTHGRSVAGSDGVELELAALRGRVAMVEAEHQERWTASGQPWHGYLRDWAEQEGLHPGERIMRSLDAQFDRQLYVEGPYYFSDLADTSEAEEQAAINAGLIQAGGIRYAAARA
jgi:hypothetical protein